MSRTERDILEEIEAIIDGKIDDAQERAKAALHLTVQAMNRNPRNPYEVQTYGTTEAHINGELCSLNVMRNYLADCLRNMEPDGNL